MLYGWYKLVKGIREQKYDPSTPNLNRTLPAAEADDDVPTLVSSPVRRCGPAFTSSPCSRLRRIATTSVATLPIKQEKRGYWVRISRFITRIGEYLPKALVLAGSDVS